MPHRASSPAASENEYDISKALVSGLANLDGLSEEEEEQTLEDTDVPPPRATLLDSNKGKPEDRLATIPRHSGVEQRDNLDIDVIDDEGDDDDGSFIAAQQTASNRKASNLKGRTVRKGGGFQAMGLNATLLKAIARKGYSVPTPIQRKAVPLVLDGQDVVGMARTGSGKTAAFVIPMVEKLKTHSSRVGARALILAPSRELALQTLKVVKELGRGTDLRSVLLVGGDSLEDQFGFMASNPDIIIATPGRFLHLQVEMSLDLSSIRYVVFDEADRLFEMGFAVQLTEILHALPASRQTLLVSATLPRSLIEFARAGLHEPQLIRLDAESKVSPDLESAFFTVKSVEKEGALLHLLSDVIKIPLGPPNLANENRKAQTERKKRKRGSERSNPTESPTKHSTIVFAATKHHVDYLATLLRLAGLAVSHAYGSLDQTARRQQVQDFRSGMTNVLVVTDVAARGIDIPILANVVNYDFPAQPKIFVHRVGRTARAGQKGRSYSLVTTSDAPYLLDLQLFLGRRLVLGREDGQSYDLARDIVLGALVREQLEQSSELLNKLLDEEAELVALRTVAAKGEKLYTRTRSHASIESTKRAKTMTVTQGWMVLHPLFFENENALERERELMLARLSGFKPQETIFEIGKRANGSEAAEIMKKRREVVEKRNGNRSSTVSAEQAGLSDSHLCKSMDVDEEHDYEGTAALDDKADHEEVDQASITDGEIEVTFLEPNMNQSKGGPEAWKDSEHFMSYTPVSNNPTEERGYGVHSGSSQSAVRGSNFMEMAKSATVDLANDEGPKAMGEASRVGGLRWDKRGKKYVSRVNDEDGSRGGKMIKSESGQKIPASFRGGRFDAWRQAHKIGRLPRLGEAESSTPKTTTVTMIGKRFRHRQERAPKDADKFRDDYHTRKRRVKEAKEKRIGRFKDGAGKREVKTVDDMHKQRKLKERRRQKNARPSRRKKA